MIYYLPTTLLFILCAGSRSGGGGGGAFAAQSEAVPVRTQLELTVPGIQSDPYMHSDYIDSNKTPIQGSGSKIESCSIQPLIDYKSLVWNFYSSFLIVFIQKKKIYWEKKKLIFLISGVGKKKATGQSTILHRFLRNEHNMRRLLPWSEFCG